MSGWDTNWDSTEAVDKLPRNILTQLRAALVERWQATNYSDAQITANLPAAPVANELLSAAWYSRLVIDEVDPRQLSRSAQ